MKFISASTAVFALFSVPVGSQTIPLHAGESVTVHVDNGRSIVERTDPAEPMTKSEAYILWRAVTQNIPAAAKTMPPTLVTKGEAPLDAPHPISDQLKLTMRRVPGLEPSSSEGTALFISNGYTSKARYRAVMYTGARSAPTDVCDVPPTLLGVEYWPYVIDRIDVSSLHLETPDGTLQCE